MDIVGGLAGVANKIRPIAQKLGTAANTLGSSQAFGAAPPPQSLTPAQATGSPVATQGPGFSDIRQPGPIGKIFSDIANRRAAAKSQTGLGATAPAVGIGAGAPSLGRSDLSFNGNSVRN